MGTAKDQFLTSLEMFLGAIPVARHKKEKYQKLRQSAQVIKDKTKAEAFCRYSTALKPFFAKLGRALITCRVVSCVRRVAGRV